MPRENSSDRPGRGQGRRHRWENFPQQSSFFQAVSPTDEIDVGKRLHDLRVEHGLSIRNLAEISDLAVNTLSLIENGKTSPSVNTLQRLAAALQVPINAFFEVVHEKKQLVYSRASERKPIEIQQTEIEDLGAGLYNWIVQPMIVTLQPEAGSGAAPIVHTGHEIVYCLEGRILYMVDDKSYLLESGDSLMFESHLPHRWENVNQTESKMLLILFPTDMRDRPAQRHFHGD